MSDPTLHDEAFLEWSFLEDEMDPCVVVSERMEFVYANRAARAYVPEDWFGKRCFELLPVADEACAFHCPKVDAVASAAEGDTPQVAYCEETLYTGKLDRVVLGVGLIPLGVHRADRAQAVFLLRKKADTADAAAFEAQLLQDASRVRGRIAAQTAA